MNRSISILSLFLACLALFSCRDNNKVEISKEEYNKLKGTTSEYPKHFKLYDDDIAMFGDGIVLGSDSHEYLVTSMNSNGKSVEHYIDSVFCAKRNKK